MFPGAFAGADYYAAQNGQTPAAPYISWETAASNIQDAVNAAGTNDTVWVGAGRYRVPTNAVWWVGTNVVYIEKPITLRSSNGIPESTIIDGEGKNRGIAVWNTNAGTSNQFIIEGFTVSNCHATNFGGGILFYHSRAVWTGTVLNCIVSDNTVAYGTNTLSTSYNLSPGAYGGGICSFLYTGPSPFAFIVSNCIIRNNRALSGLSYESSYCSSYGGGIYVRDAGQKYIVNNIIESNSATMGGGGYFEHGNTLIEKCVIRGNKALSSGNGNDQNTVQGGGWYLGSGQIAGGVPPGIHVVKNCLSYNNTSAGRGGGLLTWGGQAELYNLTITSNKAVYAGSGIGMRGVVQGSSLRMCNSIVYSNTIDDIFCDKYTNTFVTNSCVGFTNNLIDGSGNATNGLLGAGNITNSPAFANFAGQDFHLTIASPCMNSGLNQPWTDGRSLDIANRPRIDRFSGRVDMGCYEYIPKGILYKVR